MCRCRKVEDRTSKVPVGDSLHRGGEREQRTRCRTLERVRPVPRCKNQTKTMKGHAPWWAKPRRIRTAKMEDGHRLRNQATGEAAKQTAGKAANATGWSMAFRGCRISPDFSFI